VADRHGLGGQRIFPDHHDDHFHSVGHHPERVLHFALGRLDPLQHVPMLFATAFLPMFGIGGLTGIPLAFNSADLYLHDTYYVIAHFHYIVAPGTIFALFAGVYFWFPKATGRKMNEFWGKVHFWPSLICMNVIFCRCSCRECSGCIGAGMTAGRDGTWPAKRSGD
jgi:heme/copper-type cytochrome/quinol oxidase subunit 1